MTLRERYENDPSFHALVDVMLAHIEAGQFTPTEIREAAMLAQIRYEEMRPTRPIRFTTDDVIKRRI